jgi:hypothetical protein
VAQAVSRRPVTAETWVLPRVSPFEIGGVQSGFGTGFSPSTSVSSVNIIPPILHTYLHLHVAFARRTKMLRLGTSQQLESVGQKNTFTFL